MQKLFEFESFNDLYKWVMLAKKELEFPLCFRLIDKPNRSLKQNSLYWKWLGEIEKQSGDNSDFWHKEFKYQYAVPIFRSEDTEYNAMILAILELKKLGMADHFEAAKNNIIKLTSTTDFTTKQMDFYLKKIWFHAVGHGWELSHPDDQGLKGLV